MTTDGNGNMFKIGESYTITMLDNYPEGSSETSYNGQEVVEIDGNLIKVNDGWIINTQSPHFVCAKPSEMCKGLGRD